MKILIAGPESIHLSNYCRAIKPYVDEIIFISENSFSIPEAKKSFIVNFRGNFLKWTFNFKKLKKIILKEKPDVVHIHQINRLAFFVSKALEGTKIPLISTAWGSDVLLVPQGNFIYKKMTTFVIKRSVFATADATVMIEAMKKLQNENSKYQLLLYGIEPVRPLSKEKIIFSNRLHKPLYNIDIIIRDFADFSKQNSDWQLYIAGEGTETKKLKELVSQLNINERVNFIGWLNKAENDANYAKASIYVSVPSSDGTSVSLLEAMSANCIPVVSDLPVSHEWIKDGVNGIIYKSNKNPFEESLMVDKEKCFAINQEKINSMAKREQTMQKFFELYKLALSKS